MNESCCHHKNNSPAAHIDPVCGMTVDLKIDTPEHDYQGQKYYFCCKHCLEKFALDPEQYLQVKEIKISFGQPKSADTAKYTCPMHPEIVQIGFGICPICGMSLEAIMPSLTEDKDIESKYLTKKLVLALIFTCPVFVISMSSMFVDQGWFHSPMASVGQAVCASITIWGAGWLIFQRAWASAVNKNANMFTLIAIGVLVAYGYSLLAMFFPAFLPEGFRDQHGHMPIYFESACVIVSLVILGQLLEVKARQKASSAIEQLLALNPKQAHRQNVNGQVEDIDWQLIKVGDLLKVLPGEKIPADGIVIGGQAVVDQSAITGESMPVEKSVGENLIAGTINTTGSFLMKVESAGADTLLSHIIAQVAAAQRSRAPIQSTADKVSAYFVFFVLLASLFTFIIWAVYGPKPQLAWALVNAISVLIVACPCALGLATPMSVMVAVGKAAQEGILIKDAKVLEIFPKVNILALDKTGTVTEGKAKVVDIKSIGNFQENEILAWAASAANLSEHPLSRAINNLAESQNIKIYPAQDFNYQIGKGIKAKAQERTIALGNDKLMADLEISLPAANGEGKAESSRAYLAIDNKLAGVITFSDSIKKNAGFYIEQLKANNWQIYMLSGDKKENALAVAKQIGIAEKNVFANLLPEEKAEIIKKQKQAGSTVAFAGDGINDAVALAEANIGIALAHGSEISITAADITLVKGDLQTLNKAVKLGKATLSNIKQNLTFAFLYNTVGIFIAAGILYPAFGILLGPMFASAAMSASSLCVIANSLRLRTIKL